MRLIDSATLSNQDIHANLLVLTHTASAARLVTLRVFLAQIAGNGNYTVTPFIQRAGTGAVYQGPSVTKAVPSGTTSAYIVVSHVPMSDTDVLTAYVLGLAGDTTTPDIIVEVWEEDYGDVREILGTMLVESMGYLAVNLSTFLDVAVPALTVASVNQTGDAYAEILAGSTLAQMADAVLDEPVEGAYTLRQLAALMAAVLLGKASGGGAGTITFRDVNDTIDRVVATVNLLTGDRLAVTLTAP